MPKTATGQFEIVAYLLFLGVVALTGGSSHFDAASQPIVRLAAVVLIGGLILHSPKGPPLGHSRPLWFIGALAALILVQLVPLPPAWWGALPGHSRYLAAAVAAGESQPWRPLNLTPDRGWNALFALLPPAAALFATRRLRTRDQGTVLLGLIAIVLISAVVGLAQVSAGEDDALRFYAAPPTRSAVGLFANPNHHA